MVHDRLVQPRQIYASTLTRRERRWARRRTRAGGLSVVLVSAVSLLAALSVLAIVLPGVA
jgi:hypothetical protein